MINNFIFDLDGTLLDTIEQITRALNDTLIDFHLPTITVAEGKSFLGHGTEYLLSHALKGAVLDAAHYQRFKAAYMQRQIAYQLEDTKPFPGMSSLLEGLRQRQARLFVYSNKPHDFAVKLINAMFPGVFLAVVGQKPGYDPKPNVDPFLPYLEAFSVDPAASVYIGDSLVDIETARALKMRSVSVAWGYVPRERLVEARPDFLIDEPHQLLSLDFKDE